MSPEGKYSMEPVLKTYLDKCRTILNAHHSKQSKVIPLPGKKEPTKEDRQFFDAAIKDAEDTEEFEAFTKALEAGPLASDLKRLAKREERRRKKSKSKRQVNSLDEWRQDTARRAAKGFFRR